MTRKELAALKAVRRKLLKSADRAEARGDTWLVESLRKRAAQMQITISNSVLTDTTVTP